MWRKKIRTEVGLNKNKTVQQTSSQLGGIQEAILIHTDQLYLLSVK